MTLTYPPQELEDELEASIANTKSICEPDMDMLCPSSIFDMMQPGLVVDFFFAEFADAPSPPEPPKMLGEDGAGIYKPPVPVEEGEPRPGLLGQDGHGIYKPPVPPNMVGMNGHGIYRPPVDVPEEDVASPMFGQDGHGIHNVPAGRFGANGHGIRKPGHKARSLIAKEDIARLTENVSIRAPKAGAALIQKARNFFRKNVHGHGHRHGRKRRLHGDHHDHDGDHDGDHHGDHDHHKPCGGHKVKDLTFYGDEDEDREQCFISALQNAQVSKTCYEAAFDTVVIYETLVAENERVEQERMFFGFVAVLFFFGFVVLPIMLGLARCCISRSSRCQRMKEMFALRARILYAVYRDENIKASVESALGVQLGNADFPIPHHETDKEKIDDIIEGRETALPPRCRRTFCQSYCRSLMFFFGTVVFLSTPLPVLFNTVFFFLFFVICFRLVKGFCRCLCGCNKKENESEGEYEVVASGFPADIEERKSDAIFVGVPVSL